MMFSEDEMFMKKLKAFFTLRNSYDFRRTGRTHALMKILVETAIESQRPIKIIDHHLAVENYENAKRDMIRVCYNYCSELQGKIQGFYFDINRERGTLTANIQGNSSYYNDTRTPFNHYPRKKVPQNFELLLIC